MKQLRRLLALLAFVGVASCGAPVTPSYAAEYRPLVSGHRGAKDVPGVPESTMAAFKYAKNTGADIIELDVYWTKKTKTSPSYMVAIHDATLDRTTNGSGWVVDTTWSKIRTLDAGHGQRVPLFRDVIIYAKRNGLRLNAEVKGNVSAAHHDPTKSTITNAQAKRYIAVLEKYGMVDRNVMSSSSKNVVRKIQTNDIKHEMNTALISYKDDSATVARSYGDSYMPTWHQVSPAEVQALKDQGVDTYIWPIKTHEDFEKAYATKAAVLVGDNPADVVRWLNEEK